MSKGWDLLVIGAGPVGCVLAERAARLMGWRSLVVEKRGHVAGNCYDCYHETGLLIHQYGPHYFRTNDPQLTDYLSGFTEWVPGEYIVKSFTHGQYYPFPINLTTLEMFFKMSLTSESAERLLERQRVALSSPKNSEEFVLSRVGQRLYEAFYKGYTLKQWGMDPSELASTVCGRIPIRLTRDERYVDHAFQLMPKQGYTRMFANMIADPRIAVVLKTDFSSIRNRIRPRIATVYTGPIDEYFAHRYGRLEWRSLSFNFQYYARKFVQPCVQINYPNDFAYTRSIEIKHVTKQVHPHTIVAYERSTDRGVPCYPVPTERNVALYEKYSELARRETDAASVYFAGRLANYKYMDMDEAVATALSVFDTIVERWRARA
jgi:UDP-galactopyranose mutase